MFIPSETTGCERVKSKMQNDHFWSNFHKVSCVLSGIDSFVWWHKEKNLLLSQKKKIDKQTPIFDIYKA